MTQEQKAKRYDEAIEKLDVILNLNTTKESGTIFVDDVRKIFTELKENQDEKIRNFLIDFIKVCRWTEKEDQGWPLREECIAWLKKQGKKESVACPICGWEIEKQWEQKPAWSEEDEHGSDVRERAAIAAMQGLLCAPSYKADRSKLKMIAKDAISIADALMDELKKK